VDELKGTIIFEPEYRNPDAFRGIEDFSHIWLLWEFSEAVRETWSPTVRPPRLGGNKRLGVFATRSPFRPNAVGLSCVKLEKVELHTDQGPVLHVSGADLMDGTPIYDIKPYLPFADSHPEASGGYTDQTKEYGLQVKISEEILSMVSEEKRDALKAVLAHDPRPSYQNDPKRIYGMEFAGYEVKFQVEDGILYVINIEKR
jgi:tRNA-Thr(GGU) m(6)t(6)A37 methyltransferase TsaA